MVKPMFNFLYDKLSNKIGEDCAIKVLVIMGFSEVTFKPRAIEEYKYTRYVYHIDNKLRALTDKYNYLIDRKEKKDNPYMIYISKDDTIWVIIQFNQKYH